MSTMDEMNKQDNLSIVMLTSGSKFYVHDSEVSYFNDRVKKYQSDNHFTNISDLQDLDRLIVAELLVWRWGMWVSQKRDYWGEAVDENSLQKAIKEHSAELRMLKKSLGIDKETRDKLRGEGSFEEYMSQLRFRAKEFGYKRDFEHAKTIELMQQLKSIVLLYANCDADERREQHCTAEDIIDWINEKAIPEFDEIDIEFRKTQKMWIQKQ